MVMAFWKEQGLNMPKNICVCGQAAAKVLVVSSGLGSAGKPLWRAPGRKIDRSAEHVFDRSVSVDQSCRVAHVMVSIG